MSIQTEVDYYLKVAIEINKKTGGTRCYEAESNAKDKFSTIREHINNNFRQVKASLEERDKKKGANLVALNMEINEKMT